MAVITEETARKLTADGEKTLHLAAGDIVTPAAREYIREQHIALAEATDCPNDQVVGEFETIFGVKLAQKPEYMTHLRGNLLVFKDHPRIALRGKIDSLEAAIILLQLKAQEKGDDELLKDLEEIIAFIRQLLRCEVSGEAVPEFQLLGLDARSLREQSHHPSQYFGIRHFLPSVQYGEIVAQLNYLRTMTREVELAAFKAFQGAHGEMVRSDIIRAFNRLSSLFWIMMCKERQKNEA